MNIDDELKLKNVINKAQKDIDILEKGRDNRQKMNARFRLHGIIECAEYMLGKRTYLVGE